MKRLIAWCVAAALVLIALSGCGGGNDGGGLATPAPPPPLLSTGTALSQAIASAATNPANDTSTNSSSAFKVLQDSGVAAVTVGRRAGREFHRVLRRRGQAGPDAQQRQLRDRQAGPGHNGNIDQWQNYVFRTETTTGSNAVGSGPGRHAGARLGGPGIDRSEADQPGQPARLQSERLLHLHVQHRHHRSEPRPMAWCSSRTARTASRSS